MDINENQEKKKQILQKIGKYTTAAGAVLLTGNLANAIVYPTVTTVDLIGGPDGNDHYYPIDFDHDGLGEVSIGASTSYWSANSMYGWVWLTYGYDTGVTSYQQRENTNYPTWYDPAPLALNKTIGPTSNFSTWWDNQHSDTIVWTNDGSIYTWWGSASGGNFGYYPNDTRYLGVRFTGDGGAHWYYGWIGIMIYDTPLASNSASGTSLGQITGYAYETDANTAIAAGSSSTVPVLPIASALGMGLVGLFAFMRNRRKKNIV